jgi:hypothetical protein
MTKANIFTEILDSPTAAFNLSEVERTMSCAGGGNYESYGRAPALRCAIKGRASFPSDSLLGSPSLRSSRDLSYNSIPIKPEQEKEEDQEFGIFADTNALNETDTNQCIMEFPSQSFLSPLVRGEVYLTEIIDMQTTAGGFQFPVNSIALLTILLTFEQDVFEQLVATFVNSDMVHVETSHLYPVSATRGDEKEYYYTSSSREIIITCKSSSLQPPTDKRRYDASFLDTILAITYIHVKYPESADLWELVVRKSRTWLAAAFRGFTAFYKRALSASEETNGQESTSMSRVTGSELKAEMLEKVARERMRD